MCSRSNFRLEIACTPPRLPNLRFHRYYYQQQERTPSPSGARRENKDPAASEESKAEEGYWLGGYVYFRFFDPQQTRE